MARGPSPYRQAREGLPPIYVCPHDQQEFEELYQLKRHFEVQHGGFSSEEVEAATTAETAAGAQASERVPPQPRKVSRRSKELNEKLNTCMALIVKRWMHGLDETERQILAGLKGELIINALGFDFDFDKGIIPLQSKFWMVIVLLFTQAEGTVPDGAMGKIAEILKAKAKERADDSKHVN